MIGIKDSSRVMSFTSGKGGVGKTTITTNFAYRLAQLGKRVLILDGDLGMANVDIMFGVRPRGNILEVIRGEKSIQDVVTEAAKNIHIIPGGSGLFELSKINSFERRTILDGAKEICGQYDYLLVDTAPGLSENVLYLNSAVDQIQLIITPDPAAVADAYALVKVLCQHYRTKKIGVICNFVKNEVDGFGLYQRFTEVCQKFLDLSLDFTGVVPLDPVLRKCNEQQRIIMRSEPHCLASLSLSRIVQNIENQSRVQVPRGQMMDFWNHVVGVA